MIPKKPIQSIQIDDFTYELNEQQIAQYPLKERDQANLLVYRQGKIRHDRFHNLADHLPAQSLLIFNDTRVVPARLNFKKATGASIEVFLLNPEPLSFSMEQAMEKSKTCTWKCLIGNKKKWKPGETLSSGFELDEMKCQLKVDLLDRENNLVRFSWEPAGFSFSQVLNTVGQTPLPPYLHRATQVSDKDRYQTIYSAKEGAVAAPTAGLHFTDRTFEQIKAKNIRQDYVTLHVSAGTFQPIKQKNILEHQMHNEQIQIKRSNLENLLQPEQKVIAVGTTSMRTLESLYWFGVKLIRENDNRFAISKLMPYYYFDHDLPSPQESIKAIISFLDQEGRDELWGETEIFIFPGYRFMMCQGLITNFHLPGSTLILLVGAFVGKDWRTIYEEAGKHNYRFLSYGDSSLLLP